MAKNVIKKRIIHRGGLTDHGPPVHKLDGAPSLCQTERNEEKLSVDIIRIIL